MNYTVFCWFYPTKDHKLCWNVVFSRTFELFFIDNSNSVKQWYKNHFVYYTHIVDISNRFNVSRNSVYKQQAIALTAVNQAFEQADDEILYYIPVTKAYIHRAVTALYLVCRAGSRDIMSFMDLIFDYSVSIGTVSNILDKASDEAITINN